MPRPHASPPLGVPGRRRACATIAGTLSALALGCSPRRSEETRVLRVALQGEPSTLDPHRQDDLITHSVLFNVYEALTAFDADMRLQPALASNWHSLDENRWEFEVRAGARFQDGRPVTPEDVVASLERARRLPGSRTSGYLVGVGEVRARSASTVEVATAKPHALLAKKLAFVAIVPRDAPPAITAPVGTGPFRLEQASSGRVTLVREERYWGRAAAFPRVELVTVTGGPDRERMLAAGEVDLVLNLDTATVERIRTLPDVTVSSGPSLSMTYLGMRCDRGPFADVRVRRAAHLALDRAHLGQVMRRGLARPATQIVDRTVFGFDPGLPVPARDVEGARRLLAEAGQGGGLDVTLEHRQGLDARVVVGQLADAGFRVREVARPWSEMMARLVDGSVELYLGGQLCPTGDASDVLDVALHSRDEATGYGSGNYWGYASPALDALVERSSATFDQAERLALLQQAMRHLAAELPLIPLFVPYNAAAVRRGVAWQPRIDGILRVGEARPES